ncbi:MAG TPA: hypothetical protein VHB49_16000 [Bradyrhizobium sp.]|nr:hypothetical protein [Bradyrhizobium sp.]
MRTVVLLMLFAAIAASTALADPAGRRKPDYATPWSKTLPVKGASTGRSCAAYGPGFVKAEGSDTCIKLGGAVSVGVGSGTTR